MKSLKLSLLLGLVLAAMSLPAVAGPTSTQTYIPVRSKQELSALKPGTQVAHVCPHCGAITISKADKAKSQAAGSTCGVCKMQVTYQDTGGGKGPKLNLIECVDVKTGKKMAARVCVHH